MKRGNSRNTIYTAPALDELQIPAKIVTFFMYQIFYVGTSCVELSCFGAFNSNQNFPRITLIQIMVTQRNGVAAFFAEMDKK